jgi:hypothetical protein
MKTMIRAFIYLLLVYSLAMGVLAQSPPMVSAAEYFIDTDPGEGSGTAVSATDGSYNDIFESINGNLSTASLSEGMHTLYIRYKNSDNNWGKAFAKSFVVKNSSAYLFNLPATITNAEYFIDTDPGEGNGTALNADDGSYDYIFESINGNLSTASLSEGAHTLYVRYKNSDSNWGKAFAKPFVVKNSSVYLFNLPATVNNAEYFIDTDPGEGSGTAVSATDGSYTDIFESSNGSLSTVSLSEGTHTLYVRYRNSANSWGKVAARSFVVRNSSAYLFNLPTTITRAEYFIDTDPGEGSGTVLSADDGSYDDIIESVNGSQTTSSLSEGTHTLYVRYKNSANSWGKVAARSFVVKNSSAYLFNLPTTISRAEYFIDTDPGEGSGMALNAVDGNYNDIFESVNGSRSTSPLSEGTHTLYVRYKNSANSWGKVAASSFVVKNSSAYLFNLPTTITRAEYFIDTDPGEGSGTSLNATDGNYKDLFESISANLSTSSLRGGAHTVSVRYGNNNGNWGKPFTSAFGVREMPVNGLAAYYPFNGGATDESGVGNNGTVVGARLTVDRFGIQNHAYNFNGLNNEIVVADDSLLSPSSLTISLWARPAAIRCWQTFISKGGNGSGHTPQYELYYCDSLHYLSSDSFEPYYQFSANEQIANNRWQHLVLSHSNDSVRFYLNGVLDKTLNGVFTPATPTAESLYIGAEARHWDSTYYWGDLDDIRIYNRALSDSEVTLLFHEGNFGEQSISGTVFNDLNGNGVQEGGDSLLAGWRIVCKDSYGVTVDSQVTDVQGKYTLTNFAPGTYTIYEVEESGWFRTLPTGLGSYTVTISANDSITGKDFGHTRTYRYIGDSTGNWSASTSWVSGIPPTSDKFVSIPGGAVVTVDSLPSDTIRALRIESGGTLEFLPNVGKLNILRPCRIDNGATLKFQSISGTTGIICYSDLINLGTIDPGSSKVTINGDESKVLMSGLIPNTFDTLEIKGNNTSVVGNMIINTQLILIKGIDTRSQDSINVKNSDTSAIIGTGIITQGTITREIKQGETGIYRFESPGTYIKFNNQGEYPCNVAMTVLSNARIGNFYWDSLGGRVNTLENTIVVDSVRKFSRWPLGVPRPRVIQSLADQLYCKIESVNRVYAIHPDCGNNYCAQVSLRYLPTGLSHLNATDVKGMSSSSVSEEELQLFRGPYYADSVDANWNMVSLPLSPGIAIKDSVFPTSISDAFAYNGSYIESPLLKFSEGYWLKFPDPQQIILHGVDIDSVSIPVNPGWNLIGSISYPVAAAMVTPQDIIRSVFFRYKTGYIEADTLEPMHAYWIKTSASGNLILSYNANIALSKGSLSGNPLNLLNRLAIADSKLNEGTLYFGSRANIDITRYILPPLPPEGMYDVRFATGNMLAIAGEQKENEIPIRIQSAEYPVTLRWEMQDATQSGSLIVNGRITRMRQSGSIVVGDPNSEIKLSLTPSVLEELPKEYTLGQNYPNPFNPATTIRYTLPSESRVQLTIYNILGQVVSVLRDGVEDAGYRSINWNASNVASGIYFYRLEATSTCDPGKSFTKVKKMILLR